MVKVLVQKKKKVQTDKGLFPASQRCIFIATRPVWPGRDGQFVAASCTLWTLINRYLQTGEKKGHGYGHDITKARVVGERDMVQLAHQLGKAAS